MQPLLVGGGFRANSFSHQLPVDRHRVFNLVFETELFYSSDQPYLEYVWSPDSTHIAGATQQELFLIDVKSGQKVWNQDLSSSPNTLLIHWSANGKRLIVVGEKELYVQDLIPGGKQIVWPSPYQSQSLPPPFSSLSELKVAFSPDKALLAVANPDASAAVDIWNIQEKRSVVECQASQGSTQDDNFDMAWAPDGTSLAVYTGWTSGTNSPSLPTLQVYRVSDGYLLWKS